MRRLFDDEETRKMVNKTRRWLENGLQKSKKGVQRAWQEYRQEMARREREKDEREEFEAELRYRDRELDFHMLISAEEASLYEQAKQKLQEMKRRSSDPQVHKEWEAKKYLTLHEHFTERIQYYFRRRLSDPVALHRAIRYCERQIEYAPVAKRAYQMDPMVTELPEHPGYDILVTLYEEAEEWEKALRLSQEAKEEGWGGDWEERIQQLKAWADAK